MASSLSGKSLALLAALWTWLNLVSFSIAAPASVNPGPWWPGYSNLNTIFAFGDSWTSTGFSTSGTQPSPANPLGNPPLPGYTTTNGLNYIGYLGTKYNNSLLSVYDLALGGSVIDPTLDHPWLGWLTLENQVDLFLSTYTTNASAPQSWSSNTTLFTAFLGINDAVVFNRTDPELDSVFEKYQSLLSTLYDAGARNFLITNIPPINVISATQPVQYVFPEDVAGINLQITSMIARLEAAFSDITIFFGDVFALFEDVLADPTSHAQTAEYKVLDRDCEAYAGNLKHDGPVVPTAAQVESCGGLEPQEYLWLDSLHVSYPVHDAMAAMMAGVLQGLPGLPYQGMR